MNFRPLIAAVSLVAATACASGRRAAPGTTPAAQPTPPPPLPAPPSAAADHAEVVRLGPSALRYLAHQWLHAEQQFQGQTQTIERGTGLFLSATIAGPADTLGYRTTFTIDSIALDSGTTLPPTLDLSAAWGLTYTGRLTPTGVFRDERVSDSTRAAAFVQIAGVLRSFYPRLPPTGLVLGAEWTDTVTTADRVVVEVTRRSVNHSRAVAWEERGGIRSLRLEVVAAYTVSGSGEQGGQPVEVTGSGTETARHFLAVDGRYLGGEVRDSSALTVNFPFQTVTVPAHRIVRSTVTVLP